MLQTFCINHNEAKPRISGHNPPLTSIMTAKLSKPPAKPPAKSLTKCRPSDGQPDPNLLTSEQKAAKRAEVARRRSGNKQAADLQKILRCQARILSAKSQVPFDFLVEEGTMGLVKSVLGNDGRKFGHWKYAKLTIIGYLLNSIRDKYRLVRIPRKLTLIYLAEQKAIRRQPGYLEQSDANKAAAIGASLEDLLESRQAVCLFSSELNHKQADMREHIDTNDNEAAAKNQLECDIALQVLQLGSRALARKLGMAPDAVMAIATNRISQLLTDTDLESAHGN